MNRYTDEKFEMAFHRRVDASDEQGCWPWTGGKSNAYGGTTRVIDGVSRKFLAHRLAWEFANGRKLLSSEALMHSCDNPLCCNPAHLSIGTHTDNMRDMVAKGRHWAQRKTHCPQGHPYDQHNTRLDKLKSGGIRRTCRACEGYHFRLAKKRHSARDTAASASA